MTFVERLVFIAGMIASMAWPAIGVGALTLGLAVHRGRPSPESAARAVLGMFAVPLLLLVVAAAFYGRSGAGPREFDWLTGLFSAVAVAGIGVAFAIAIRGRRASGWILWLGVAAVVWLMAAVWFIGSMALVDDWI